MFHIIIVDDEQTIRDGLTKYIKKTFPQLSVDGVFCDGTEAIEFVKTNEVDIILTDIKMSLKSGIDIAKYAYENKLPAKTIFLSGYQEFENAKQALAYNVKYYLSKPVKLAELKDALNQLISQIEAERERINQISEEKQRFENLLTMLKKDFYTDILLGITEEPMDICVRAQKISLDEEFLKHTQCALLSVCIKNKNSWNYQNDDLYPYLLNLLREITGFNSAIPIIHENDEIFFLLELNDYRTEEDLNLTLKNDLKTMALTAAELLGIELDYELLYCGMEIYSLTQYRSPSVGKFSNSALMEEKCKELLSKIIVHNRQGAQEILDALRRRTEDMPVGDSYVLLTHLFSKIYETFSDAILPDDSFHFTEDISHEDLFMQGDKVLNDIFDRAPGDSQSFADLTIEKAKKYIEEHLADSIGLEEVAGHVYLNPAYFSRFFKLHTKMTMTEYLTQRRIQLAEQLLKSHKYKIQEISQRCGYRSSKYFTKLFKQYTGYTPSEYIRTLS